MVVSPEFAAPFATGFLAPMVGLDPHSCTLGPVELRYALEHELAHIARGDTRLALGVELARRCFIGHPSARWLIAELGWAREAAVDARVAGDSPRGYAQFLVASAERCSLARAASTSSVFMANTALEFRLECQLAKLRSHTRVRFGCDPSYLSVAGEAQSLPGGLGSERTLQCTRKARCPRPVSPGYQSPRAGLQLEAARPGQHQCRCVALAENRGGRVDRERAGSRFCVLEDLSALETVTARQLSTSK
jgi:hypothetical protein